MDFKKLFENNKAVSPVIGVILMVAITVILAAAIGSSVFGKGTTESAPQANFDIKAGNTSIAEDSATIKVEHLGGDPIHFEGTTPVTKVVASFNDKSYVIAANDTSTGLDTMSVGDVKKLTLKSTDSSKKVPAIGTGITVNIKFIDTETNQLICDKDVRF